MEPTIHPLDSRLRVRITYNSDHLFVEVQRKRWWWWKTVETDIFGNSPIITPALEIWLWKQALKWRMK